MIQPLFKTVPSVWNTRPYPLSAEPEKAFTVAASKNAGQCVCTLCAALRLAGVAAMHQPLSQIVPLPFDVAAVLPGSVETLDALFFTSQNAVFAFFNSEAPEVRQIQARCKAHHPHPIRVGSIGSKTTQALNALDIPAAFTSPVSYGAAAAEHFIAYLNTLGEHGAFPAQVLWPCPQKPEPGFQHGMSASSQIHLTAVVVYKTQSFETLPETVNTLLKHWEIVEATAVEVSSPLPQQGVVFTSPSGIHAAQQLLSATQWQLLTKCSAYVMGPTTRQAAVQAGLTRIEQPEDTSLRALGEHIIQHRAMVQLP